MALLKVARLCGGVNFAQTTAGGASESLDWRDSLEEGINYVGASLTTDQTARLFLDVADEVTGTTPSGQETLRSMEVVANTAKTFKPTLLTKRWYRWRLTNTSGNAFTSVRCYEQLTSIGEAPTSFESLHISTATTTVVKTGPGIFHGFIIEGGTAGTITVYDNTSAAGKILANFDLTNTLATYLFDVDYTIGLTVVTGNATKLTVSYL